MSPSTENIKLNQPASRYQCVGWYQIERKKVGDKFLYFLHYETSHFIGVWQNLLNIYCHNVMKYCRPTTGSHSYSQWTKGWSLTVSLLAINVVDWMRAIGSKTHGPRLRRDVECQ